MPRETRRDKHESSSSHYSRQEDDDEEVSLQEDKLSLPSSVKNNPFWDSTFTTYNEADDDSVHLLIEKLWSRSMMTTNHTLPNDNN
jgi:hypothetical protein